MDMPDEGKKVRDVLVCVQVRHGEATSPTSEPIKEVRKGRTRSFCTVSMIERNGAALSRRGHNIERRVWLER